MSLHATLPERLLARLKHDQQAYALDALRRPNARDAFEYGHRVGLVQGYEAAITVLLQLLNEERDSDPDL